MKQNTDYCVILAGGKGRRLWPCSREMKPKQFVDFFGVGRTQLQQTYDVMTAIVPSENVLIATGVDYLPLVKEQLPMVAEENILAEPVQRNTAPSVAWAVHRIMRRNRKANIVVVPSDQSVIDKAAFSQNIVEGLRFVAENDCILTIGVKPTRPETGYGYIQKGENGEAKGIYKVQAFTEKPDQNFAEMFVKSGEWSWNTGMFIANAGYLQHCLEQYLPVVLRKFDLLYPDFTLAEETLYMQEHFRLYPNLSLDSGVFEKSDNVFVMECGFGWADLGSWNSIYENADKGEEDNVEMSSDVLFDDARNNIISVPKGKLAVIQGLDGYVVAEKDNVLLVCRRQNSSEMIRKFINEVRLQKGEDYV